MDNENIECVSISDGMEDEEEMESSSTSQITHQQQFSSKRNNNVGNNNINGLPPATSVHELLECPVCTNSMYPPIHQVCFFLLFTFLFCFFIGFLVNLEFGINICDLDLKVYM